MTTATERNRASRCGVVASGMFVRRLSTPGRIVIVALFALAIAVPSFASVCTHCSSSDARMVAPCCADHCPMHMQHAKPAKIGRATAPKRVVPVAPVAVVASSNRVAPDFATAASRVVAADVNTPPRFLLFAQLLI